MFISQEVRDCWSLDWSSAEVHMLTGLLCWEELQKTTSLQQALTTRVPAGCFHPGPWSLSPYEWHLVGLGTCSGGGDGFRFSTRVEVQCTDRVALSHNPNSI